MPPPPKQGPEPEYEEKRVLAELSEKPSSEWDVPPQIARLMKLLIGRTEKAEKAADVAEKKLKGRNTMRLVYGLCGALGIGGGGVGTWNAHDRADGLGHRVHELEEAKKDVEARLRAAERAIDHCCP